MNEFWLLLLLCVAATYFWRGLGMLLSGRIAVDSDLFRWLECVAYAMITGLIVRMIVLPGGTLAATPLSVRLLACSVGLLCYRLCRKSLPAAVAGGTLVMLLAGYLGTA
jgi:branched-subunit amino acid transport protein